MCSENARDIRGRQWEERNRSRHKQVLIVPRAFAALNKYWYRVTRRPIRIGAYKASRLHLRLSIHAATRTHARAIPVPSRRVTTSLPIDDILRHEISRDKKRKIYYICSAKRKRGLISWIFLLYVSLVSFCYRWVAIAVAWWCQASIPIDARPILAETIVKLSIFDFSFN